MIFLASLFLFFALAHAQSIISVTNPLSNQVWTIGSTVNIVWQNPTVEQISIISLARGPPTLLQPVRTIAENVNANSLSITWTVPADVEPDTNYALMFGSSPNLAFAGPITIASAAVSSTSSAESSSSSEATSSTISEPTGSSTSLYSSRTLSTTVNSPTPSASVNSTRNINDIDLSGSINVQSYVGTKMIYTIISLFIIVIIL